MRFFLLLFALFTIGFYIQQQQLKDNGREVQSADEGMYFSAPSFDPTKMRAGDSPIFKGLGNPRCPISSGSAKARQYFNQGLTLMYAFNHGEAGRSLNYQELPDWFFSVRHTLGYVQVKAKKFKEAEATYKDELENLPGTGWALMGLYNSLKGQDKIEEAADVKKRFD